MGNSAYVCKHRMFSWWSRPLNFLYLISFCMSLRQTVFFTKILKKCQKSIRTLQSSEHTTQNQLYTELYIAAAMLVKVVIKSRR